MPRGVGFDDAGIVALVVACPSAVSVNAIGDALGLPAAHRSAPFAGNDGSA